MMARPKAASWMAGGLALLALSGCGLGDYVRGATASRTFTAPLEEVRTAAVQALHNMDVTLQDDMPSPRGRKLRASTLDRAVEIDLENVTYNATRMQVAVTFNETVLRDGDTAREIVRQTTTSLEAPVLSPAAPRAALPAPPSPRPKMRQTSR